MCFIMVTKFSIKSDKIFLILTFSFLGAIVLSPSIELQFDSLFCSLVQVFDLGRVLPESPVMLLSPAIELYGLRKVGFISPRSKSFPEWGRELTEYRLASEFRLVVLRPKVPPNWGYLLENADRRFDDVLLEALLSVFPSDVSLSTAIGTACKL